MKRLFILLVLIIFCIIENTKAQEQWKKPNYQQIEKEIKDNNSNYYYPSLMKRYLLADTTLTIEEKQHLYYGGQFQSYYSPYGISDFHDSLKTLLNKDSLKVVEKIKVIRFCDSILKENPFDMKTMNIQRYFYKEVNDKQNWILNTHKINTEIDAILSTGDGKTMNTAFYVINVSEEYVILNVLDYEFIGPQRLIERTDFLTVKENDDKIEGLYFDVSASFASLDKMFKNDDSIKSQLKGTSKKKKKK